jgi:polyvinyl alcohol dehydrogenase (cytochrome)
VAVLAGAGAVVPSGGAAGAASTTDWTAYQHGPSHSNAAVGDTTITPGNVASLQPVWTFRSGPARRAGAPGPRFDASPTVADGRVYIGSRTGVEYALDVDTGSVVWSKQLDWGSNAVCPAKGITATATVAPDPVTGVSTVYAAGAHHVYALDAVTGKQRWKRAIGPATATGEARWYNWSSPTVVGGRVYMGLAANCDDDKVRGGVEQLNQHTGKRLRTWYAVPKGHVGPSVWSSMAGDGRSVWVTTGNPDPAETQVYDAFSIVRLSASRLKKQEKWTTSTPIADDLDFGSSPTFFTATIGGTGTDLIGACNKNGIYYAWRRTNLKAGPVWQRRVGDTGGNGVGSCITSAAYDEPSSTLFVAANQTTVNGVTVQGSVRALDAATGAVRWEQPLACRPTGSPTLNATTHVLAVPLFGCPDTVQPGVSLFDAQTGQPLRTIHTADKVFAQPVFADGKLFIADESGVLTAYAP